MLTNAYGGSSSSLLGTLRGGRTTIQSRPTTTTSITTITIQITTIVHSIIRRKSASGAAIPGPHYASAQWGVRFACKASNIFIIYPHSVTLGEGDVVLRLLGNTRQCRPSTYELK